MKLSVRKSSIGINELLYYFAFTIFVFATVIKLSMLGQNSLTLELITVLRAVGIVLALFSLLLRTRFNITYAILVMTILLTCCLVIVWMGDSGGMLLLMIMFGAWKCSGKILAKLHLICVGTVVFVSFLASYFGMVEDRVSYFYRSANVILARHSWGLTYTTIFAAIIFFLSADILYLKKKKSNILLVILLLISYWVYLTTQSRLEFGMTALMCLAFFFFPLWDKICNTKIVKFILTNIFWICAVISLVMTFFYMHNQTKFSTINYLMTGRLSFAARGISQYGFSLFGQVIRMQGGGSIDFDKSFGYFFIDSYYLNWLLIYGVVLMTFLCILFFWINKKLVKEKNSKVLLLMLLACIHGIIISSIMQPQINPFFAIAIAEISKNPKKNNIKCEIKG